ncbi:hypothetical protein PMAYCL1PPCAC_32754 [Pristionchus mayeri]|uniref:Uncharacterized protein n=1 Tax=Pristionchus mayeri TaxID=1317129 RepID=A0AAN5DIC5_9BILA|nr:hypothetical protein PMAYCL1PPCAC_32754 [Pristionchus mayeri]
MNPRIQKSGYQPCSSRFLLELPQQFLSLLRIIELHPQRRPVGHLDSIPHISHRDLVPTLLLQSGGRVQSQHARRRHEEW